MTLATITITESENPYTPDARYVATCHLGLVATIGHGATPREAILDLLEQLDW